MATYQLALQVGADADGYSPFRWVWESMALLAPTEAIALYQQQLTRQRQRQNQAKVAGLLQTLGHILTAAGDLPGAVAALTEFGPLAETWHPLAQGWNKSRLFGFGVGPLPGPGTPTGAGLCPTGNPTLSGSC
ncbi:MAG: hypothetical protein R3E79_59120 [Caldilineaceae bacterium]